MANGKLQRQVGIIGAVMMGLGAIVGTGIFVSLAQATSVAGHWIVIAITVAALVAACNGLSSAQLAAAHPVSGGTYEYGYRWLHPSLGFTAGWMFLCAKSASAATAVLGFATYAVALCGSTSSVLRSVIGLVTLACVTALVYSGIRRSNAINIAIVVFTLGALLCFVIFGVLTLSGTDWRAVEQARDIGSHLSEDRNPVTFTDFMQGCALMFVAFTGYGRIATLGEEITDPRRNIPRAIIATLAVSLLLYLSVAWVAVSVAGPEALARASQQQLAPLAAIAQEFKYPWVANLVALGAMTAMLGVLLNLILGLSRVVLAMARRGDLPALLATVNADRSSPGPAVIAVGAIIATLTMIGDMRLTWSFSAFTVLIYYTITNLAALRLSKVEQRYPRAVAYLGCLACLGLAFWVDTKVWLTGVGLILLGLIWWNHRRRFQATEVG